VLAVVSARSSRHFQSAQRGFDDLYRFFDVGLVIPSVFVLDEQVLGGYLRDARVWEVADVIGPRPAPNVMTYLHQTVGNGFVQQVLFAGSGGGGGGNGPQPQQSQQPAKYHPPANAFIVNVDGQYVQVYVSPDGVDTSPDVFMFFHGQVANLKIDPAMKDQGSDNVSGNDTAGAAMAKGKEKNTIALLPQGFRGGAHSAGGRMDAIIKYGLEKFLDDVLAAANLQIGAPSALTPRHISLAGHSAGGHKGIHEALANTGKYADTISDITLMDTSYGETHFEEARDWAFTGSPNKTIRIVQGTGQLKNDIYKKQDELEETDPLHKPAVYEGHAYWSRVFSDAALDTAVKAHPGMTINHIQKFDFQKSKSYGAGEDRGNMTEMVQHTQIVKDGKVQCDILVLHSELGHHEIRDSTMDDAINSIGQGAAGSDQFGRHDDDPTYGRDPSKPHSGNSRTADEIKKDQAARDAKRRRKK